VLQDDDEPTSEGGDQQDAAEADAAADAPPRKPWQWPRVRRITTSVKTWTKSAWKDEDIKLAALVEAWVDSSRDDPVTRTFIETEWADRLTSYRTQARSWRIAQVSIWLVVTALGSLISVLAGFNSGQDFAIVAGALVALLTTLTNAIHPNKKADGYVTARRRLRDEGWQLVHHTGDYEDRTDEERYMHFVGRVNAIVETKRASTGFDEVTP
jgi:hypothetical protein